MAVGGWRENGGEGSGFGGGGRFWGGGTKIFGWRESCFAGNKKGNEVVAKLLGF